MARTTKLLDGRKTVKMTGRVYLRAIVPIGAFFSLSLICGNLTYLYLSVAFIQMLKVCEWFLQVETIDVLMVITGYDTRCSSTYRMGHGNSQSRYESPLQRVLHSPWHHHCLSWRSKVRPYRSHLSAWRHIVRSNQTCYGGTTAQLRRVQDGSFGLALLLCSSLRHHELLYSFGV